VGLEEIFEAWPHQSTVPAHSATMSIQLVNDLGASSPYNAACLMGQVQSGKAYQLHGSYSKFEPNMPEGAIIDKIRVAYLSKGPTGTGSTYLVKGGLLRRDGTWDDSDGFVGYADRTAVPKPYADGGVTITNTLWWDDASAWTINVHMAGNVAENTIISVAEGYSGTHIVPGLLAHFQSYWNDTGVGSNQASRGSGLSADGIPVCFHMHSTAVAANLFCNFKSGLADQPYVPLLFIEWHSYDGVASLTSTTTLAATGTVLQGVAGVASLTSTDTLTATATLIVRGLAALTSTDTLTATATLIVRGLAALTSTDTLTATATLIVRGLAALTSTDTLTATATLIVRGLAALTSTDTLTALGTVIALGGPEFGITEQIIVGPTAVIAARDLLPAVVAVPSPAQTVAVEPTTIRIVRGSTTCAARLAEPGTIVFQVGIANPVQVATPSVRVGRGAAQVVVSRGGVQTPVVNDSTTAKVVRGSATITASRETDPVVLTDTST